MADVVEESFWEGVSTEGLHRVDNGEALRLLKQFDEEGLVHTLWTAGPPLAVCVCNCRQGDCLAMRVTLDLETQAFFRGEYVAAVDRERCTECGLCVERCQFGAVAQAADGGPFRVEAQACYGCGLCATACPVGAVRLCDRAAVPQVSAVW